MHIDRDASAVIGYGDAVVLVDRDLDSALETKSMIDKEGGESFVFQADITAEENCRQIPEACVEKFGQIDVLVNNVGIGTGDGNVVTISEDVWSNILNVNLKGMFLTCKYVLPEMEKRETGSIININPYHWDMPLFFSRSLSNHSICSSSVIFELSRSTESSALFNGLAARVESW